jgi:hypothetical protein
VQKFERIDFDYLNFTNLMVDKAHAAAAESKTRETFEASPEEQFEVVDANELSDKRPEEADSMAFEESTSGQRKTETQRSDKVRTGI